jgi:hypothetical protein
MQRRSLIVFLSCVLYCCTAQGQERRNLLTAKYSESALPSILLTRDRWHPYPTIDDRQGWNVIPGQVRSACVQNAMQFLKTAWEPLPANIFLEYVRTGNRSNYERISFARREKLAALVLGEVFENQGRFLDDISNGVWAICEESFWGVPAHIGAQHRGSGLPDVTEPIVDLFAAETGSLLSWTAYLLGSKLDNVSPLVTERIYLEVDRRILAPNLQRDDFWWMGFGERRNVNNWNPWINSNWLTAALLLERDSARREKAVFKIMRSLDNFLNIYPDDGGCDEGPGYWGRAGASLFDCLELLRSATNGAIDLYGVPLIQKIGQYIYKVYINGEYFINFADASGKINPEAGLIYRYGKGIGDPVMTGFGAFLARKQELGRESRIPRTGSLGRLLPELLGINDLKAATPLEPLLRDFYLPDLQVMGARSLANASKGLYLAAKGGHNAESHNHNDVGNFIVYADGKPVLIDVGVETYTAKTFSSRRYEIWTMQSGFHNLPTINGVMQKDGREFQAQDVSYNASDSIASFSLNLAKAYPDAAKVSNWLRTLTLFRGKRLELSEKFILKEFIQPFALNLMTPLWVDLSAPGKVILSDARTSASLKVVISYDRAQFTAASEEIKLTDGRLRAVWGDRVARIVLSSTGSAIQGDYKITVDLQGNGTL